MNIRNMIYQCPYCGAFHNEKPTFYTINGIKYPIEEPKMCKWEEDWEIGCSRCSVCGESYLWEDFDGVAEWNFCPNCGSKVNKNEKK